MSPRFFVVIFYRRTGFRRFISLIALLGNFIRYFKLNSVFKLIQQTKTRVASPLFRALRRHPDPDSFVQHTKPCFDKNVFFKIEMYFLKMC